MAGLGPQTDSNCSPQPSASFPMSITLGWDSQWRDLKVWFESLTRGHPVLEFSLPGFSFRRVRRVPHRALVNRAAGRLSHPASIPRAIMSRSPEALALGPAVISFRRRYHCPSFGCRFNRSRDCTRSRVPPLSRRRDADPPAGASFPCSWKALCARIDVCFAKRIGLSRT